MPEYKGKIYGYNEVWPEGMWQELSEKYGSGDKMENLLKDAYEERDKLKEENEVWRNQWHGFESHKLNYWTIDIEKPRILLHGINPLEWIAKFMSQDVEKLYKAYIVVCIVCTVITTLVEIGRNAREWK